MLQAPVTTLALCASVITAVLLIAVGVHAQSAQPWQPASPSVGRPRLLLMRAEEPRRTAFEQRVERALSRTLAELGFSVSVSPLPFHEVQLASGCMGAFQECGSQVAALLESEQLLVSSLSEQSGAEPPSVRLARFAPQTRVRSADAQLPRELGEDLELTVRALIESLFSDVVETRARTNAEPAQPLASPALDDEVATMPAPATVANQSAGRSAGQKVMLAIGWPSLALGAGLIVGGAFQSLASQRAKDAYAAQSTNTPEDVDRKLAHSRQYYQKADGARVLWGVGGGLLAAGALVLLWERFGPSPDRKLQSSARASGSLHVFAAPSRNGLSLAVAAEL